MKVEKIFQYIIIFAFCLIAVWFMTDKNPVSYEMDSAQPDSIVNEKVKIIPDSNLIRQLDSLESLLKKEKAKAKAVQTQIIEIRDTVYIDSVKQLTKERNYSFNFDSLGFSIRLKASLTKKKDNINLNLYPYDIWMIKKNIYKTIYKRDNRFRLGYGLYLRKRVDYGYSVGISGILYKNRYSFMIGIENEGVFVGINKYLR